MIPKYTQFELDTAKSSTLLKVECEYCHSDFYTETRHVKKVLRKTAVRNQCKYCSVYCKNAAIIKKVEVCCKNCSKLFLKLPSQITSNNFCSKTCSATYNNKNKKHGTRVSKLELWLKEQLTILYPDLEILYNNKEAIGSELDIYIPSLKLAFELNGIFHYEPIFGVDKLIKTQNNDISKSKACFDNGIDLCIIDTSSQTYVKPTTSQKYLKIIATILDNYKI